MLCPFRKETNWVSTGLNGYGTVTASLTREDFVDCIEGKCMAYTKSLKIGDSNCKLCNK